MSATPAIAAQKLGSNIPAAAPTMKPGYVRIMLEDSDKIPPTGQFFGLNGNGYMLRAGEEANVPAGIIEILDNAVESYAIKNGSNQIVGYRNRHRFPYRVVRTEAA